MHFPAKKVFGGGGGTGQETAGNCRRVAGPKNQVWENKKLCSTFGPYKAAFAEVAFDTLRYFGEEHVE